MPAAKQASSCSAGDRDFWMLAPISPTSMRFMACLALVSDLSRQPENRLRNRSDEGQNSNRRENERCGLAHDRPQRLLGHAGKHEEQQPVGRREEPNHDVDHYDDTEMHEIDTEDLRRWDENG